MSPVQRSLKFSFDVSLAAIGLVFFGPLILICIVIARIDTGESGIFTQRRIGRHAKPFNLYKIRSMRSDTKIVNNITVSNDPRITRSGKVFRRFKFDELPQLWNVLKGEMSLVGPRPDVPGYADQLAGEQRAILELRPGVTGPATLKYRDEEQILARQINPAHYNDHVLYPDKVRVNLDYLKQYSVVQDVKYLLITANLMSLPRSLLHAADSQNSRGTSSAHS